MSEDIFWLFQLEEGAMVSSGWRVGYYSTSCSAQDSPHDKDYPAPMSVGLRLGNHGLGAPANWPGGKRFIPVVGLKKGSLKSPEEKRSCW